MTEKIVLTGYEQELLKLALPYAVKLEEAGDTLTRDGLRRELSCGKDIASRLQHYIRDNQMVKVAERLAAIPETAEIRNEVQAALGDPTSGYGHVVRDNARLKREVSRLRARGDAEKEARAQEARAEIESIKNLDRTVAPPAKPALVTSNMLQIAVADAHLGKLSWDRETGHESYDTKIADAMYRRAQSTLFERAKGVKIDKVLILLGNDMINSDTAEGTTTRGTQVSNDGRYHKTYYRARTLAIDSIEQARKIAPVYVVILPGNHDRLAMFHIGDALEMYFHGQSDVIIDNAPTSRKYFQYGKVMLMFCHGDREKRGDLAGIMAAEQPAMWGVTKFREAHIGHLHQTRTEEKNGVRVRILPSISPPDAWHSEQGYVGNLRSAEGYIWNAEEGLIGQVFYTDDGQKPITTKREIV